MSTPQWYAAPQGRQIGPLPTESLYHMVATGNLQAADLVWREGMAEWQPLSAIPELANAAASAPATATAVLPYGTPPSTYQTQPVYAGFWLRFCAAFIDGIIMGIVGFIIGGIVGFIIGAAMGASGADPGAIQLVTGFAGQILGIVAGWLYYALMESSTQRATLGKMAVGVVVTDLDGNQISFARASGRHFAKYLSMLTLLIGYIMAGFTQRKQALHDIVASTLVTKKSVISPVI